MCKRTYYNTGVCGRDYSRLECTAYSDGSVLVFLFADGDQRDVQLNRAQIIDLIEQLENFVDNAPDTIEGDDLA